MTGPVVLKRETFTQSLNMEFFSEKSLTTRIGHSRFRWAVAITKELIDNGIDAAESAGIAPEITVEAHAGALIISDNGPGLPLDTLEKSLNLEFKVSDKAGYVSPSRGQQGNALKTVWAAPFVATGTGRVDIETAEYRRTVTVALDRIEQTPVLSLIDAGAGDVKNGTKITVHWPEVACLTGYAGAGIFYNLLRSTADFNPHVRISAVTPGWDYAAHATAPGWQHWRPDRPTAPHWYALDRFRALVALMLHAERKGGRQKSVNEFIREFHGLSATAKAKAIAQETGLSGAMLRDLVENGDIDSGKLCALLDAMKAASRPPKPEALGVLGAEHFTCRLTQHGAAADSIAYRCAKGTTGDGLPFVLEVGFGVQAELSGRILSCGINCAAALDNPFSALDIALGSANCSLSDPIVMLVHLACPEVRFSDHGKARAILPAEIEDEVQKLVASVTARFSAAKRKADRDGRLADRDLRALLDANKEKPMSTKAAAWRVMKVAYMQASDGGTLPANARQIMYAARPLIIELTGKASPWANSATFTQGLLPDFMTAHPELCASWDVVFDNRGHFSEPHTGRTIGVGTLAVRNYVNGWNSLIGMDDTLPALPERLHTQGPALRYRFALFLEKEGFNQLLDRARIAERYDIPILSTKGMSNTAARALLDRLSAAGVTMLVAHDFDQAGFTIAHTLKTDGRRYQFANRPLLVDIGLRLADVKAMNLQSEAVDFRCDTDPRPGLLLRGATQEEAEFLVSGKTNGGRWTGKRVELNAMNSAQFIAWLEAKLEAHGVRKFIPDDDTALAAAYQRAWRIRELNARIADIARSIGTAPPPPVDLRDRITATLDRHPAMAWDAALLPD